jgi:short-subunit dehydrogenase
MNKDFSQQYGPWALVTGASSGIGEALWQELKSHNVDVLTLAPGSTDTEALTKPVPAAQLLFRIPRERRVQTISGT